LLLFFLLEELDFIGRKYSINLLLEVDDLIEPSVLDFLGMIPLKLSRISSVKLSLRSDAPRWIS
jgi:hypothetical protein